MTGVAGGVNREEMVNGEDDKEEARAEGTEEVGKVVLGDAVVTDRIESESALLQRTVGGLALRLAETMAEGLGLVETTVGGP